MLTPLKCAACETSAIHISGGDNAAGSFSFAIGAGEKNFAEWNRKYEEAK